MGPSREFGRSSEYRGGTRARSPAFWGGLPEFLRDSPDKTAANCEILSRETLLAGSSVGYDIANYDDARELTEYVWFNYTQFLTDTERLAIRAVHAEFKARHLDERHAEDLRKRWGAVGRPDVEAALSNGVEAFVIEFVTEFSRIVQPKSLLTAAISALG